MGKDIPHKQKQKESWGSNTHIRQSRLKNKKHKKIEKSHYIIVKGSIQEDYTIIINIYTFNIGATKYIKQLLMDKKGDTHHKTITVENFNTQLTSVTR